RLAFQHGNFTAESTALMSMIFFYYSWSLLLYSGVRILTFYLFARQQAGAYLRLSVLQYGLNVVFDLAFVGVLRVGAKGIPLGLVTTLAVIVAFALYRDLAGFRRAFDRSLALFGIKIVSASALTSIVVWGLRLWVRAPLGGAQSLLYLIELCGAGSLVFFAALAGLGAVRASDLTALWQGAEAE
ncbi:MAG TPA: lipid II flippase MurJ, partial [Terriglobia bacterium]|nr:lipid II flippase MurJ [Terriglobia bacterium]